jgi:hypothetical protein
MCRRGCLIVFSRARPGRPGNANAERRKVEKTFIPAYAGSMFFAWEQRLGVSGAGARGGEI